MYQAIQALHAQRLTNKYGFLDGCKPSWPAVAGFLDWVHEVRGLNMISHCRSFEFHKSEFSDKQSLVASADNFVQVR